MGLQCMRESKIAGSQIRRGVKEMTIKKVYEKYKHLDKLFSDRKWIILPDDHPINTIFYELWQAIKEEVVKAGK